MCLSILLFNIIQKELNNQFNKKESGGIKIGK